MFANAEAVVRAVSDFGRPASTSSTSRCPNKPAGAGGPSAGYPDVPVAFLRPSGGAGQR